MFYDFGQLPVEPPSMATMFGLYISPVPVFVIGAVIASTLYVVGVVRLRRLGRRWPLWQTASFLLGCLALAAVTGLTVEGYSFGLFSAFMFQHLTLSILVPPLLVLGAPGTLLLRATPHRGAGRVVLQGALGALRSRGARVLLHPGLTVPLFLFSYYGLYLSSAFDLIAGSWMGHVALEAFFLFSGILFIVPILSPDPLPTRQSNLGRFFDIFVEMPLHVFIGVVLMIAPRALTTTFANPPASWGVDPVADQSVAGALAWSFGEPVAVFIVLVFAVRWRRDETENAQRHEASGVDADAELSAYNAYLADLRNPGTAQRGVDGPSGTQDYLTT